jgi:hypothetical protein
MVNKPESAKVIQLASLNNSYSVRNDLNHNSSGLIVKSLRSKSRPALIVSGKMDVSKTKIEPPIEFKKPN